MCVSGRWTDRGSAYEFIQATEQEKHKWKKCQYSYANLVGQLCQYNNNIQSYLRWNLHRRATFHDKRRKVMVWGVIIVVIPVQVNHSNVMLRWGDVGIVAVLVLMRVNLHSFLGSVSVSWFISWTWSTRFNNVLNIIVVILAWYDNTFIQGGRLFRMIFDDVNKCPGPHGFANAHQELSGTAAPLQWWIYYHEMLSFRVRQILSA